MTQTSVKTELEALVNEAQTMVADLKLDLYDPEIQGVTNANIEAAKQVEINIKQAAFWLSQITE